MLPVPQARALLLREILDRLAAAERVVLTTHVNSDGDGCGSEAAVAAWLERRGGSATIVNPTPFPDALRFLLHREDLVAELGTPAAERALREADLFVVLDTSEPNRVAPLLPALDRARTVVIDHHPAGPDVVGSLALQDPTAAATGELVFDLLTLAGEPWPAACDLGMYVAVVSDTGSFRFGNTTPRVHAIAADLLSRGIDPEQVFQRLFATQPRRRLDLLRAALAGLQHDEALGVTWMTIPRSTAEELGVTGEDFEGLIDHARSVQGTRVAILARETDRGETKLSLRSNGDADVNAIARRFGGGGHVKASGALVEGPPQTVMPRVLEAVRDALTE